MWARARVRESFAYVGARVCPQSTLISSFSIIRPTAVRAEYFWLKVLFAPLPAGSYPPGDIQLARTPDAPWNIASQRVKLIMPALTKE
eukprot:SAG11_NODE_7202_length_1178_cov_1.767377_2_plen_88_part_00